MEAFTLAGNLLLFAPSLPGSTSVDRFIRQRRAAAANRRASGRDLVPMKASVIEDELEKLGLDFQAHARRRKRLAHSGAYEAGRIAGRTFEPRRSLEAADAA